ncbi:MAG: branched-chain amino acid aminotransferase [Planctomycetaceae bacterium]|nr:branched-chain amino acid aminotransferase [Planctomycetaceae bacterium]
MSQLSTQLLNDEAGFLVSGELVLIATILVLGLVVGLAEVSHSINQELEDVASAFGSVNQSFYFSGSYGHKADFSGSQFGDIGDDCDGQFDINGDGANPEY